jgi:hypothetical protein
VTILRVGTNAKYSEGWASAFGGKKAAAKTETKGGTAKGKAAKGKSPAKKVTVKAVKKKAAAPKKAAKKKKK